MSGRTFHIGVGGAARRVSQQTDGSWQIDGSPAHVEPVGPGEWRVILEGRAHRVWTAGPPESPWIWHDGVAYRPEVADAARQARARTPDTAGSLSAPMPATVRAIAVSPGDRVARGDVLLVLEAMKMELPLKAPIDGTVAALACQVGDLVQPGVPLVELA